MKGFRRVLVLVLLLPELVMAAQCRVGEVVRLVGEVSVVRPARQFVPVIGMQICMGDRFVTGAPVLPSFVCAMAH